MINSTDYKRFLDWWHEIKENVEGQLENMGFDLASKKQAQGELKQNLISFTYIVGHVVIKKIPDVISLISKSF